MCGVVELPVYRVPVGVVFLNVFCVKFYIILSYPLGFSHPSLLLSPKGDILSIKTNQNNLFFATCLGKEHFIEVILEALLRSVVCKNGTWVPTIL